MKSFLRFSLPFLFCIFQLVLNVNSYAAIININITSSDTIVACKENQFVAKYIAPGIHGISIKAFLTASSGSTNTFCDNSINLFPNVYIIVDSIINASTTNPLTDTSGHNCIWHDSLLAVANDTVFIYYHLAIDCAALSGASSNLILNQLFTNNGIGTDTFRVNNSIPATDTLYKAVLRPFLLKTTQPNFYANYLDTLDLTFTYKNTGGGDANISFRFYPDSIDCSGLNTLSLWHADSIGGVFDTLTKGILTDAFIKAGKTLVIKQRVLVDKCLSGCTNDTAKLFWQCNTLPSDNGIFCQGCQDEFETVYSILDADSPRVSILRIAPSLPVASWDNSCMNDSANMLQWNYMITNKDSGAIDSLIILLTSPDKGNILTLVPAGSFFIDTSKCLDCTASIRTDTINTTLFCTNIVPVPLDTAYVLVRRLRPGDTLYVHFSTFRCVEENDPLLLNSPKVYNQWELQITGKSICNRQLVSPTGGSLFFPSYGGYGGIGSSFDGSSVADLDMELNFTPSVSHLAVDPGQQFGDAAIFNIGIDKISKKGNLYYSQIFGCQGINCIWNGYLRARVYCDTGLVIMNPDSDVFFSIYDTSSASPLYIYPDYYNDSILDSSCSAGYYYFYFNLHDTITMKMLQSGFFNFRLQACCGGGAEGEAFYNVAFYLMPDPDNCLTLTFTDTNHVQPPNCSGLGCAWLPMSSVDGSVQVHCPGCIAPGIIADYYEMRRENFGLQDGDNDGKADIGLTIVTPGSVWYNTYEPFLGIHNSSFGDQLVDRLTAHFQPGDNTNGGYNYSQMQLGGGFLNYLQLMRTIPGGNDTVGLQVSSFTLYIDTPTTANSNCINCALFNIDTSQFRTMRIINVSGSALTQYLQVQGSQYFFTFSSVHNYATGSDSGTLHTNILFDDSLSPFHTFFEGQKYRLAVHYDQCGLFDPVFQNDNPLSYRRQAAIDNRMWLSGQKQTLASLATTGPMPGDTNDLIANGWSLNPGDSNYVDSLFAGGFLFYCETFGSIHYFYTSLLTNETNITKDSSCIRNIETTGRVSVAGGVYDIYPYEYMTPKLGASVYKVDVPPGYYIDSAWARTRTSAFEITNYLYFKPIDSTGTVYIPESSLPKMKCLDENTNFSLPANDTNSFFGDKRFQRELKIRCRPFSCSDTTYIYRDTTVILSFDTVSPSCLIFSSCGLDSIRHRYTVPVNNGKGTGVLANLKADTVAPVKAKAHQVCFPVTITNPSQLIGTYYTTDAYHLFIIVPNSTQAPELSNWSFNDGVNTFFPNVNGVLNIREIMNPNGNVSGNLCANYNPCVGTDTIQFYYGWNCNGYPFSKDSSVICGLDSFTRIFVDELVNFQPQGKLPPPFFHLCDTFDVVIPYNSSAAGGVQPDSVQLTNLPANLSLINVYIEKCTPDSTEPLSIATSPLTWQIKGSDLDSIGFSDSLLSAGECMNVRIRLLANCGYTGEQIYSVTLYSHNFCGDTIISTTDCDNKYIDEGSYCTECFTITKTALADTVFIGDTMSYIIKICGINSSSQSVILTDLIPAGFDTIGSYTSFWSIPANGCITDTISGTYHWSGSANDTNIINTAIITTGSSATLSDTASVTVVESCFDPDYVLISDSTFASAGPSITTGDTVYVFGRWYIDIDLTLTNCYVIVSMGGHIFVNPGHFLTLDSSIITGCEAMWRGIRVENESGITLENGSIIADARHGLYMTKYSLFFNIRNSSIIDCIKEIYTEPSDSGGYNPTTCEIYGSTFGYRYGLKPKYPVQPNHGAIAATNIEINDLTNVVIGDDNQNPNKFFRSNRGVTVIGSNLTITNSEFEGIVKDTFYGWYYDGYAIAARENQTTGQNSRLWVYPLANATNPPTIHDGFRGVYSRHSNLDVRGLYMTNMVGGTMSEFSNGNTVTILNNKIEASRSGIRWRFNAGAVNMTAQQNEIILSGDTTGTGISLIETSSGIPNYNVLENTITLSDSRHGIRSSGCQYPVISGNILKLNRASNPIRKYGITVNGCDSAQVTCNIVSGYDDADTLIRAFNINISPYGYVKCNTADSTGWGIYFGGVSLFTSFKGNVMHNHKHGLHLNSVAVIDTQSFAGNRWMAYYDTTNGSWGAVNMNDASALTLSKSLIEYDPSAPYDSTYFPFTPTVNPNDNGWFDPFPGGGAFECTQDNSCTISDGSAGGSLELRQAIAQDTTITSEFIEQSKAIAQISLYSELSVDSVTYASDTILQNFKNNNENQPVGYLYKAKKSFNTIYKWDSTLISTKYLTDSLFNFYSDSLTYIDSLLKINPDSLLFIQRKNIVAQISVLNSNFQFLLNQREFFVSNKITEAEASNSLVIANRLPEENAKTINVIEAAFLRNGIDGIVSYYEQIISIASQCPYEGGEPVYRAASLAELLNDSISFEYDEVCSQQGYFREQGYSTIKKEVTIKIIPNPATDQIKVKIEGEPGGICLITINDAIGTKQMEFSFNCKDKEHTIDIKNLSPGVYFVKTIFENNKLFVNKITVIR